jgi:uncharacterized protein YcgI (DUF1989 family)
VLDRGDTIRVVNPHGTQVVDTWAVARADVSEHLSMEHTRAVLLSLRPRVGDALQSSARRPMLTIVEDTSPGVHDTLVAACDAERYRQLGHVGHHDNCHDNYVQALGELGYDADAVPAPLNLFMNVPWDEEGGLAFAAPVCAPGDAVVLRAEMDVIVVLSACPQDLIPVNGSLQRPTHVDVELATGAGADAPDMVPRP